MGVRKAEELGFLLDEEELLRAEDGAWSRDSYPAYELLCGDVEVFHGPETYQSACASQPGFAVDGDCPGLRLAEVSLAYVQEVLYYVFRWV